MMISSGSSLVADFPLRLKHVKAPKFVIEILVVTLLKSFSTISLLLAHN